jgi:hypothetical protein
MSFLAFGGVILASAAAIVKNVVKTPKTIGVYAGMALLGFGGYCISRQIWSSRDKRKHNNKREENKESQLPCFQKADLTNVFEGIQPFVPKEIVQIIWNYAKTFGIRLYERHDHFYLTFEYPLSKIDASTDYWFYCVLSNKEIPEILHTTMELSADKITYRIEKPKMYKNSSDLIFEVGFMSAPNFGIRSMNPYPRPRLYVSLGKCLFHNPQDPNLLTEWELIQSTDHPSLELLM